MARKTRKQKMRAAASIPQVVQKTKPTPVAVTVSAEDIAEAQVTKRGIMKTLIIIGLLFVLQALVFMGKSKGVLPF